MKKRYATLFSALFLGGAICASCTDKKDAFAEEVINTIHKVNNYWQTNHPEHGRSFWDNAAYHTGNMEAYFLTKQPEYLEYSKAWAEHNEWKGAKSDHKENWKYSYGESDDYVLFGDYQICFQTYADLYNLEPDTQKIARAREVMEYQMSTPNHDYWWWADGLYMVMPVMTKMYNITKNPLYLEKLHEYLSYADSIMYDEEAGLYYRDGKYVYPKHKSVNGKKDFWARGDGWVLAGLAKVLKELPETDKYRPEYIDRFRTLAKSVAACQQPEGYWTRSMSTHCMHRDRKPVERLSLPMVYNGESITVSWMLQNISRWLKKHGNISQQLLCSLMARLVMCNRLVRKRYPVRW